MLPGTKQQQIQAEGDLHGFGRLSAHGPVNGEQDIVNGAGIELGSGSDAAPVDQRKVGREGLDGTIDPIAAGCLCGTAKLDEIVGRGKGNQEASVVAQDTPEFARIHAAGDRQNDGEGAVGVRQESIGIGHDPLAAAVRWRITPRREIHGPSGDIDAVRLKTSLAGERAEVETVPASGIENHVGRTRGDHLGDSHQQRLGHAAIVQSPTGRDGRQRVAGLLRPALLRLQQVEVSAAGDVEGMSARTEQSPLRARQLQVAATDGAEEHDRL